MALRALKKQIRGLLQEGKLEEVAELATETKRVLGALISLTFDSDLQVVWRAIEAMGMAVERLVPSSKRYLKEHMRRLYWLITEEAGAVFWRAPECMAECCARAPGLFASHVPIAFHLLETLEEEDLEHFRPGAIWAVGRLHELAKEDMTSLLPLVIEALDRADPQARGMAVWCLGEVGHTSALKGRPDLLDDHGPVSIYRDRALITTTVASLAEEAMGNTPRSS